ncbi:filamentous hemagglutinin N-terminal domain-containing protein [Pleurocapsa sp. PCC 7319]|uniref:two-partner secretion domain-containing protein n=1 Tax=Pleurocapsa sp. PCC 7319 TaxID=118161 RepID=UPI00034BE8D9|nr:filamentous hemagglutinin N-terminal domain-containing protein [Pleurocapsa sp. PCC 7319]
MKPCSSILLGFFLGSVFIAPVQAQISPDRTTNTTVTPIDNGIRIDDGDQAGGNLFHSFEQFSVPNGSEAFFNNANDIVNIFSRVTGGSISNIDGLIRANDTANLFLINPAGIIFGKNASLNIGGSFLGSTVSSILFSDGIEFSATDSENPPLLTINAPLGLGLEDNPRQIVNRSVVENSAEEVVGLEVAPGNDLALIGGQIDFEGGQVTAMGGNIELGGLSVAGTVGINSDGSFSFPEGVTQADINLSNGADVDARGAGGGNITVNAGNLNLAAGEFRKSFIRAGIRPESTSAEAQAGNVTIDVAEKITLNDSRITNRVESGGVGNSGRIVINTGSIEAINGGDIDASTGGQGNAGTVELTATGDITIDGEESEGFPSGVSSAVNPGAEGDAGGVTISTNNLTLTKGARVVVSTFGRGNAGTVELTATGDITIDGETSQGFPSVVSSQVAPGAEGDAGGVTISTNNLILTNGGQVDATTFGQGNAGTVELTATGDITIDGEESEGFPSGVSSAVNPGAEGDAGGVTISTNNLTLTNGGRVDATTFGRGNAGTVELTATGDITIDGETSQVFPSSVSSAVNPGAEGDAGGVTISTNNLTLTKGGRVDATTFGQGNAGTVELTATGDITIDGEESEGFPSGASSAVNPGAEGDAGGVTISTNNLTLTKGGRVDVSTFGQGNAGTIELTATGDITIDGETSQGFPSGATSMVDSDAEGDAGGITISATNLTLTNGGRVVASTSGQGETENSGNINLRADNIFLLDNSLISAEALNNSANGGNIDIDAGFVVAFPNQNNDIIANAAQGTGGNINISTNSIFGIEERSSLPANETNDIDASSEFGLDGTIAINQLDVNPVEALEELPMSLIDVVGLVAQNLCQQGKGSEFIVTGKGGVAPNPSQVREGEISDVDLVAPATGEESEKVETVKGTGADKEIEEEKEIVEAQGWIINDRGKVELVAQKTDVNGASPQPKNDKICRR